MFSYDSPHLRTQVIPFTVPKVIQLHDLYNEIDNDVSIQHWIP